MGPEFGSQHPLWAAYNCLQLQLQWSASLCGYPYACGIHMCKARGTHARTHENTYLSKRELIFVLCPGVAEVHFLCLLSFGSYSVLLPIALGLALLILTLRCSFEPSSIIICHFHQWVDCEWWRMAYLSFVCRGFGTRVVHPVMINSAVSYSWVTVWIKFVLIKENDIFPHVSHYLLFPFFIATVGQAGKGCLILKRLFFCL